MNMTWMVSSNLCQPPSHTSNKNNQASSKQHPETFYLNICKSTSHSTVWRCLLTLELLVHQETTKSSGMISSTGWWYTYPSEKYESQLGVLFPIYGQIKHVPNHQPYIYVYIYYTIYAAWSKYIKNKTCFCYDHPIIILDFCGEWLDKNIAEFRPWHRPAHLHGTVERTGCFEIAKPKKRSMVPIFTRPGKR